MARERLKDFLRSRGGGEMLNYVIADGGDQSYDPGIDDLGVDNMSGQELKPLIRDFLSEITQINDYPIAPGGEDIVLTTPEGDPAPLESAESTGASRVFVESNRLQEYSDSGKFTQFVGPTGLVDKTRGQGGNELLPGVKGTGLNSTGATYVESSSTDTLPTVVTSVLKRENRYTPDSGEQFVSTNTPSTTLDQRPLVVPSELGKFIPTDRAVTFDDLRKIGTSLLLKAAQVDTADTPNESLRVDDVDSLSVEAFAGANFLNPNTPGATNKVDTRLFEATRADGSSQDLINKNKPLFSTPAGEGQTSYGTMNTPISPFNGPLPAAMMAQAAVGIGIVGGGTLVLSTLLGLLPAIRQENPVRGPYLRGRSDVPSTAAALAELVGVSRSTFGFISTRNPYIDCVKAGTLSFFGAGGGGVTSVTGLASSVLESPGYYVVIIRSILRSIIQIEEALKGFNSSGVSLQNLSAAVTLFDTIRRSRIIGYLNALAAIGDVLLVNSPSGFTFVAGSFGIDPKPGLDPTFPANRVMLSRESAAPIAGLSALAPDYPTYFAGASGRLAWRMGSAVASYLIPRTIFTGEIGTSPTESAVMHTNMRGKSVLNESGRLPKTVVSDIEAMLDAEYVPFYFHDLRTNEVIGFHAFLDSLDDNFNVSATTEAAFGRLDGVKVYGGTTRSISFGFVIAATSEQDFDEMWFRINKLVTLVYPQWTPGDEVVGSEREGGWSPKYKVPFSQVISSSPLIRVRIGDVIASNYSKFGLSRFFGATDKETVLSNPGENVRGENARRTRFDSDSDLGKKLDDRFYPPGSGASRDLANILVTSPDINVILKPSMGKNYTLTPPVNSAETGDIPIKTYFPIRGSITQADFSKAYVEQKALDTLKGAAADAAPRLYFNVKITDERYTDDIKDSTVKVMWSDVMLDPDNGPEVTTTNPTLAAQPNVLDKEKSSFFDPATNAVVRAFESTQGKGLAGMITSLKFTWLDGNNTWEVSRGSRAPMWCKVSIGMDVIHDLPLGMAHDGFMIAPAYPVGNINRRFFGTPYTSPTEPYSVPVQEGNDDLARVTNDPKVRNASSIDPAATAQSIAGGGG